ncbi:hypothetical protein DV711_18880 [Motiliproteus coralliicola]|uniref:Uncharacterized protein n=1 Tax=Motiliproteus coralliicola TaxID=2283196 RepID=A0A369W8C0_9GAMM|nr:hypothetical protein [Motiliproteus coralliicola]RDE18162.1 hypothetical protein DV711_18880 [Motiliproteus coralliicola]
MRWLFLILLLVNGVLYGWFYQEQERRRLLADRAEQALRGIPELDLLSEVPSTVLRHRDGAEQATKGKQSAGGIKMPAEKSSRYCYRFGPFERSDGIALSTANNAPGRLELEPITGTNRQQRYRVIVMAPTDLQQRQQLVDAMLVVGLDARWVEDEQQKLLVGSYREALPAEALSKALVEQGYDAEVEFGLQQAEQFFLILQSDDDNLISSNWVQMLVKKHPKIKSEKKLCLGVATPQARE